MKTCIARLRAGRLRGRLPSCGLALALALLLGLSTQEATAQTYQGRSSAPLIVRNDLGGDVGVRANRIRAMADAGQSVEIRGSACYSACTMYLGLPRSCISRNTQFGFHRPSFYGAALPPDQFEFWSQVIAAHYPPAIKSWYLSQGRYSANLQMLSGAQLIGLGVPECGNA